jgi:hypothetical protein
LKPLGVGKIPTPIIFIWRKRSFIMNNKFYNVKNRSSSRVVYRIPEINIRREFMPGETKKIDHEELEKLSYRPGGENLISNYL